MKSKWTIDALKEHLLALREADLEHLREMRAASYLASEQRAESNDRALSAALTSVTTATAAALAAAKEAVTKAEGGVQQSTLANKAEINLRFDNIDKIVAEIRDSSTRLGGRSQGISASFATIAQTIASLGAVAGIAVLIFRG